MTDQNMEHPTLGTRRKHKSSPSLQSMPTLLVLDWPTTLILRSILQTRKVEKKRSDRSQSRLHLFLFPADPQASTMRLWESLKWILGKPKGSKRGWVLSTMMQLKSHQTQAIRSASRNLTSVTGRIYSPSWAQSGR